MVWAVANVLHFLSFPDRISVHRPFSSLVVIAAALVILNPQAIWPLLLMLSFSIANTTEWMPYAPNHITFEFIINVGILSALSWSIGHHYLRHGFKTLLGTSAFRDNLYNSFAPFVRISLLVLYFYAVLHKLNWDYFNLNISCSTFLLQGYAERLPFVPDNIVVRWMAVWGTIVIEAAIPILLCFRNTRSAGILLGFGFHYFLSFHPHIGLYSFSAMLFALYALFTPVDFPAKIQIIAKDIIGNSLQKTVFVFRVLSVISIAILLVIALLGEDFIAHAIYKLTLIGLCLWCGWGLLLIVTYVLYMRRCKLELEGAFAMFRIRPVGFWFVPLLILLNGMSPYLGLKTQTSFSMFSNLRTEGGISNHIFMPSSLQINDLQKDLVEIKATDLNEMKQYISNDQYITYFEFQRIVSEANKNFYVNYMRNNQPQSIKMLNNISTKPELQIPHNWIVGKLVRFRPIDKGVCLCKH
jgi:hypothetical protein